MLLQGHKMHCVVLRKPASKLSKHYRVHFLCLQTKHKFLPKPAAVSPRAEQWEGTDYRLPQQKEQRCSAVVLFCCPCHLLIASTVFHPDAVLHYDSYFWIDGERCDSTWLTLFCPQICKEVSGTSLPGLSGLALCQVTMKNKIESRIREGHWWMTWNSHIDRFRDLEGQSWFFCWFYFNSISSATIEG